MESVNLTFGLYPFLIEIYKHDGVSQEDLAKILYLNESTVTRNLEKLEKKGFVTKERDPEDARRVCIRLTLEGRKAEAAHHWFHRQMVHNIGKSFAPEERDLLLKVIRDLNDFFIAKSHELEKIYSLDNSEPSVLDADKAE